MLAELNQARTDPRAYARHLEAMLPWYQGTTMRQPGTNVVVRTQEGGAAVREAIRVLRATSPLHELTASRGMSLAARDHVRDQERSGGVGHSGRDGSSAADRVNRYGSWSLTLSENIAYGPPTAREVVIGLIVDDGVPGRGHRRNILDPMIAFAGIACGTHPEYRRMCVIKHAGGYADGVRAK
ncbi:MAG TPA: CAP domain-containing protein [Gemmatimonadaceae bacterium]|nr:CAP domain-containing protein [Gemmatimonadaceae bacterium]